MLSVYLVIVIMAMEEGLLPEDHARQHTAQGPHVQTVVIHLQHTQYKCQRKNTQKRTLYQTPSNPTMSCLNER